ncbi:hypothetical protein ABIF86_005837 [Bradyrhizobium japonicum]
MDSLKDFFDALTTVLSIITSSTATAALSAVGVILLFLTVFLAYFALKTPPEKLSRAVWVALYATLIGGITFSAAGPGLALFYVSQNAIKRMGNEQALKNLQENSKANYVVRMVSYDPLEEPGLALDRLESLGPKEQVYSFVASYDELVGYTASEAVEKVGGTYMPGNRVSAIIFPLRTPLYPANARGLMQVINEVEHRKDIPELKERFFIAERSLGDDAEGELRSRAIERYRIESFKTNYRRYCELSQHFKCDKASYSARSYIGGVSRDWHPLGFSQRRPDKDPCTLPAETYCEFKDWDKVTAQYRKDFGARVFLIRNLEIAKIPGRILLDFDSPNDQRIPDIGTR